MKKFFNTAGPCRPDWHYMVPAEARLVEARGLIDQNGFFVVHAPRQTGKTTTLLSLAKALTAEGRFAALHFSCEAGEVAGDDYAAAERLVVAAMRGAAELYLPVELRPPEPWPAASAGSLLAVGLQAWAQACVRPLALFFDEIDALRGDSLKTVLRQLRAGYPSRPTGFPAAVVLCGLRDVRDYKAASGGEPARLGTSSPFNVKVASLKLGNFTLDEVRALYAEHHAETGQAFTGEAAERAFELTAGQPWLVNALARETVEKLGLEPPEPITAAHVDQAKERLILARQTHLDSLVAKLLEPRVRRVIAPLMAGEDVADVPAQDARGPYDDDVQYVRDLGLVSPRPPLRVANPIYREVMVRVLASEAEDKVDLEPRSFVRADGTLDLEKILVEFTAFWKEHGDVLAGRMPYHEVAPQLVFMAYLQRVVNGGGYVDREYGVGRGRIDLLVRWGGQREALELKVWVDGRPDPLKKGMEQLDRYLEGLGLDHGVLVLFDRRAKAAPAARRTKSRVTRSPAGRAVTVLRA